MTVTYFTHNIRESHLSCLSSVSFIFLLISSSLLLIASFSF